MLGCGAAQVIGGHVQVDLRAGDQAMAEQIADRDQADAGADQVGRERVSQAVWRERLADARAMAPHVHAMIDGAA